MSQNKVPITRLGKFFSGDDYNLDISMGQEWLNGDMNFKVVLYSVDRYKTKTDDVYGETVSDGIKFHPPIELNGLVKILPPEGKKIGNSKIQLDEPGNMTFSIYQKQLEDLNVDIAFGDYLGYYETETRVRYYSVVDDGRITSDNKHSYGGYRAFYRTIVAAPVTNNEFRGI
jgi:hypothetical protein